MFSFNWTFYDAHVLIKKKKGKRKKMKKKIIILTLILTLFCSLMVFIPNKSVSAHTSSGGMNDNSYFIDYDNLDSSTSFNGYSYTIQVRDITLELNKTNDNHLYIVGLTYSLDLWFNNSGSIHIPLISCVERYIDITDILSDVNSYCYGAIQFEVTIVEQELYTRLWVTTTQEIIEDNDSCFFYEESFQFNGDLYCGFLMTLISNRYDLRKTNIPQDYSQIYDSGYQDGYQIGNQEGYNEGYQIGNQEGYNEGYREALDAGNGESFNAGYNSGYYDGNNDGYIKGYDKGYDVGLIKGQENGESVNADFGEMILNVLDAPRQAISNVLNFEFLGINLGNLVFFLITIILVVFVIKFFI